MKSNNSFTISYYQLSLQIKKYRCFSTWPLAVLYRLTLANCEPTLSVCTVNQRAVPSEATSPQGFLCIETAAIEQNRLWYRDTAK